jgi:RNA polymerase sigma-70 factor (ECF subfamily)
MSEQPGFRPSAATFPTTCWSRVVAAAATGAPQAKEALAELCSAYWYPVYATIRRRGYAPDRALDLTQDYFVRVLEKETLSAADERKGRFRAFLKTDCDFFLRHRREADHAQKRGGGQVRLSIDAGDAEGRYIREPADDLTPERLFDRTWALSLLDGVLERLAAEHAAAGRTRQFECLQVVLSQGERTMSYAAMAEQLGMTESAVQQAVSRLRKRYRAILREHIAATLDQPSDETINEEVRELFEALGS